MITAKHGGATIALNRPGGGNIGRRGREDQTIEGSERSGGEAACDNQINVTNDD